MVISIGDTIKVYGTRFNNSNIGLDMSYKGVCYPLKEMLGSVLLKIERKKKPMSIIESLTGKISDKEAEIVFRYSEIKDFFYINKVVGTKLLLTEKKPSHSRYNRVKTIYGYSNKNLNTLFVATNY